MLPLTAKLLSYISGSIVQISEWLVPCRRYLIVLLSSAQAFDFLQRCIVIIFHFERLLGIGVMC